MPRRPNLDRPTKLEIHLPESIRSELDLRLFSELEGRVPLGSYSRFFLSLLHDAFKSRKLDLEPYGFPQGFFVSGPKEMIDSLERRLQQ